MFVQFTEHHTYPTAEGFEHINPAITAPCLDLLPWSARNPRGWPRMDVTGQ